MSTEERAKETTLSVLEKVFAGYPANDFAVRLWDGTVWPDESPSSPRFTRSARMPLSLLRG